ncbi:hypothetical protein TNCT_135842 [Trichonephila clavata]|uniref:Uncharacterized protein n=1 Tax=Trichonephila clavata TaxID=2740835 RepID=A0A8X6GIW7_TRICU|nr:hypothetical protein TNCT_135842 [Trichonephila clavata]
MSIENDSFGKPVADRERSRIPVGNYLGENSSYSELPLELGTTSLPVFSYHARTGYRYLPQPAYESGPESLNIYRVDSPLPPSPEGVRRSKRAEVNDNPEQIPISPEKIPISPEQLPISPEPRRTENSERFRNFAKKVKFIKYQNQCHSNVTHEIIVIWSFTGVVVVFLRALSICLDLLSVFLGYRVFRTLACINASAVVFMIFTGTCTFFIVDPGSCSEFLYYALYLNIAVWVTILLALMVNLIGWCCLFRHPDPIIDVQRQPLLS